MSDLDPGHAMPPVPDGWTMHRRNDATIILPWFARKDGVAVKYSVDLGCWAVFACTGEQLKEFGTSYTPQSMMAHVDAVEPLAGHNAMPRGTFVGPHFQELFHELHRLDLFSVAWRPGPGWSADLTEKGRLALALLECMSRPS